MSKPTLPLLIKELRPHVSDLWEDIGIQLNLDIGKLEALKTTANHTSQSRLREMLKMWCKSENSPPTWRDLVEALETLDEQKVANRIQKTYCRKYGS